MTAEAPSDPPDSQPIRESKPEAAPGDGLNTAVTPQMNEEILLEAFRNLRERLSSGTDGVTYAEYGSNAEENIRQLWRRGAGSNYTVQPLRVVAPRGNGEHRPLSPASLEDLIVEHAVVMLLSASYERKFLDCAYGLHPERGPDQALDHLKQVICAQPTPWILQWSVESYVGETVRNELFGMVRKSTRDETVLRLVKQWINVGVLEYGRQLKNEARTGQPRPIISLLANIYLHEMLDKWFEEMAKPHLNGDSHEIRFAGDVILYFEQKNDAERVMAVLPSRFKKYGLTLNPKKVRLIEFGRDSTENASKEERQADSFDFLGFKFECARRQDGEPIVVVRPLSIPEPKPIVRNEAAVPGGAAPELETSPTERDSQATAPKSHQATGAELNDSHAVAPSSEPQSNLDQPGPTSGSAEPTPIAAEANTNQQSSSAPPAQTPTAGPSAQAATAVGPQLMPTTASSGQSQVGIPLQRKGAGQGTVRVKLSDLDVHPGVELALRQLGLFDTWDLLWKKQTNGKHLLGKSGLAALLESTEFGTVKKGQTYLCYSNTWILRHLKLFSPQATVHVTVHSTVTKQQLRAEVIAEYALRPIYYRIPAEQSWGRRLLAAFRVAPLSELFASMNLELFSQWTGYSKSSMSNRK